MQIIGYSYEADLHCIRHTRERFGPAYDQAIDNEGNPVHQVFSTDTLDGPFYCSECIYAKVVAREIKALKLSAVQQEVINCLGAGYSMIQSYDFPVRLEGKVYAMNHIPDEVVCRASTKDRLLKLGLITCSESNGTKFYCLTDRGKQCVHGKPWSPYDESPAIQEKTDDA